MPEETSATVRVSMWSSPSSGDYEPLFQRLWQEQILPEVERRAPGTDARDFVSHAEIAQLRDGSTLVRLNGESKAAFLFRYVGPPTTSDAIGFSTWQFIDDVTIVNFGEGDEIAVHEVIIRGRQGWWLAYDFRSERKQIAIHCATATQFLYTARAAVEAGMLHAFVPALFDATEQIAYATLLLTPHPQILRLRKHKDTVDQFTRWTDLGNADPALLHVFKTFERLRNTARFRPQDLALTDEQCRSALSVVEGSSSRLLTPAYALGPFATPPMA